MLRGHRRALLARQDLSAPARAAHADMDTPCFGSRQCHLLLLDPQARDGPVSPPRGRRVEPARRLPARPPAAAASRSAAWRRPCPLAPRGPPSVDGERDPCPRRRPAFARVRRDAAAVGSRPPAWTRPAHVVSGARATHGLPRTRRAPARGAVRVPPRSLARPAQGGPPARQLSKDVGTALVFSKGIEKRGEKTKCEAGAWAADMRAGGALGLSRTQLCVEPDQHNSGLRSCGVEPERHILSLLAWAKVMTWAESIGLPRLRSLASSTKSLPTPARNTGQIVIAVLEFPLDESLPELLCIDLMSNASEMPDPAMLSENRKRQPQKSPVPMNPIVIPVGGPSCLSWLRLHSVAPRSDACSLLGRRRVHLCRQYSHDSLVGCSNRLFK